MITHRLIHPEFDQNFGFLGFTNMLLFDVNHVIDPAIQHDDLYFLFTRITQFLAPNQNLPIQNLRVNQTAAYRVAEINLPNLWNMLEQNNMTQGAPRRIRSILAVTAEFSIIPHGHFNITDAKFYIHCDLMPP